MNVLVFKTGKNTYYGDYVEKINSVYVTENPQLNAKKIWQKWVSHTNKLVDQYHKELTAKNHNLTIRKEMVFREKLNFKEWFEVEYASQIKPIQLYSEFTTKFI